MTLLQISEPGESAKEVCKKRFIGIDLGTTNSIVAHVRDGRPLAFTDQGGNALVPSVVHFAGGGECLIGEAAQAMAVSNPKATISSAKRFLGRSSKELEGSSLATPYEIEADGSVVRFRVSKERAVTPVEVSAVILRALKERAETQLGAEVEGAIVTVPAYFDDAQRQATKDAGRLAGLNVQRLINEPTAAALAYGLDKGSQGLYAVYDLGGGTFDISILKLVDGVFEVKSTAGDSALGGDDFDHAIADVILQEVGLGGSESKGLLRSVLNASRAAKERLSREAVTDIVVNRADGTQFRRTITKEELDTWLAPIVERITKPCRRALKDAGISGKDLDGVVLVGGATRTPIVREHVRNVFGKEPLADIDPDKVVAMGAAVQADILAGGSGKSDVLLLDVIPLSLGLEMMGGVVEKIIPRNSTIPAGATQTFTTFADGQTGFDLHVLQGERETVDACRSLAKFKLGGLPPKAAGLARMDVTFLVDADGILRVMAHEQDTGKEASIQVKPSYGLSDEEVERMLMDSYEHAEEDLKQRQVIIERVEAERIINALEDAMQSDADLLEQDVRAGIDSTLATLRKEMQGDDYHAIRDGVEALDVVSKPFAQRRMERSIARGMQGKKISEVESKL